MDPETNGDSATIDLAGRVGIVIGAASGIGLEIARACSRRGARLVLADLAADRLEQVAAELSADGAEVVSLAGDITDERYLEQIVSAADAIGPLDFAANVVGIAIGSPVVTDYDVDHWRRVVDVNLTGTLLSMKHELRAFARHRRPGSIVNFASSIGANVAMPGGSAYAASKAAVAMLTKCAALEVAATGVRINVVAPGATQTPMTDALPPGASAAVAESHPLRRFARADEIAAAAVWLASSASSFVTGTVLTVDGGFAAGTAISLDG